MLAAYVVLCADATLPRSAARSLPPWTLAAQRKLPSTLLREIRMPEASATVRTGPLNPQILEYLNMADYTHQTRSSVPVDVPLFQPVPAQVDFHSHAPFCTYEAVLLLRNSDSCARRVKVLAPENAAHFRIKAQERLGGTGKVAAGMEVAYTIQFTPDGAGDYACDLVVVTEREKFVVPVRARGCKPALDIPDRLELPAGVSKQRVTRQLLVCNVGTAEARFDLDTSAPFEVSPRYGELAVGGTLRVTISLVPPTKGSYVGELEVSFTNGERVVAELVGLVWRSPLRAMC